MSDPWHPIFVFNDQVLRGEDCFDISAAKPIMVADISPRNGVNLVVVLVLLKVMVDPGSIPANRIARVQDRRERSVFHLDKWKGFFCRFYAGSHDNRHGFAPVTYFISGYRILVPDGLPDPARAISAGDDCFYARRCHRLAHIEMVDEGMCFSRSQHTRMVGAPKAQVSHKHSLARNFIPPVNALQFLTDNLNHGSAW